MRATTNCNHALSTSKFFCGPLIAPLLVSLRTLDGGLAGRRGARFWCQTGATPPVSLGSNRPVKPRGKRGEGGSFATYVLPKTALTGERPSAAKLNSFSALGFTGATRRSRTGDLLITNHGRGDHHRSRRNKTREKWGLCWNRGRW